MKLVNAELFLNINIEENKPSVLIIENPKVMTEVVGQLYELFNAAAVFCHCNTGTSAPAK